MRKRLGVQNLTDYGGISVSDRFPQKIQELSTNPQSQKHSISFCESLDISMHVTRPDLF